MISAIINSAANIVFDFIAIKVGADVFGIGLATALSQYLSMAYLFLHFTREDRMLHFVPLDMNAKEFGELMLRGTEKAVRRLSNVIRPIILNKLIIFYGGAVAMTAMSVNNSVGDFTDRKSTRLNSSHRHTSRMPSSA